MHQYTSIMYWVPCVWASLSYFVRICLYYQVYKTIQYYSNFDGFTTTLISLLPALLTSLWSIDSEQIETVYGYQITHASPLKKTCYSIRWRSCWLNTPPSKTESKFWEKMLSSCWLFAFTLCKYWVKKRFLCDSLWWKIYYH